MCRCFLKWLYVFLKFNLKELEPLPSSGNVESQRGVASTKGKSPAGRLEDGTLPEQVGTADLNCVPEPLHRIAFCVFMYNVGRTRKLSSTVPRTN